MKRTTLLLKSLLLAVGLLAGVNATVNAQDVWTFSDTGVWGNMTSGGKTATYKELSTGSEVWFAPDGTTATSATSNVAFKFSAGDGNEEGARFNYGGTNYLGIQKNYDSTNDINYVKVVVPDKYRVNIEVHTGSSGRPMKVNLDGTETSYTADATYDYTNTTGATQTIKVYATNAKAGDWKTNSVKSITLINTQTTATHSWSANAVATIGGTATTIKTYSSEADVMEGVDYTITVDKAIIYNEKCYVLNDATFPANIYSKTYTMGDAAGAHSFTYEEVENFAFYGEAENIVSAQSNGAAEEGSFFSNGKGYRAQASSGYVTLAFNVAETGVYHIALGMNNNNNRERGYNYAIDGGDVSETYTVAINSPSVLEFNQALESGDHTITMNITYSRTPCFDYLLITKFPDNVPVTISSAGWATLYTQYAIDFAKTTLTAYTATVKPTDSSVELTPVPSVPANTGVVLKGDPGTYNIPVIPSSDTTDKGELKGNATAATTYDADYSRYYLAINNEGTEVQFKKLNESGTIAAGKAYLEIPVAVVPAPDARTLSVVFAGETTAIDAIANVKEQNGEVYNLAGQRVAKPAKGLYIVSGKKVIIK